MNGWLKKAFHTPYFVVLFGLSLLLILVSAAAPLLAPHDPIENNYGHMLEGSSWTWPLGTDQIGRCILSRLLYGGRTSLLVVFVVIFCSLVIGLGLGILSGWCGGRVDQAISALLNLAMSIPVTVFIIAYVGMMGPGLNHTMEAMILTGWCAYAKISRSLVLSMKGRPYMEEAKLSGVGPAGLLVRYILPNIAPYFVVIVTQDIGDKLLSLAGLSLLGLASQPPVPEWGFMLSEGRKYMQTASWMILYPGLVIVLHVMVFSLLGDCLRDLLEPGNRRALMGDPKDIRKKHWRKKKI